MKYVTLNEWAKFVNKWYNDYRNKNTRNGFLAVVTDAKMGRVRITNTKTGKSVIAMCHKNDYFNERVGIAVAWARYNGAEIPTLVEDNNERSKLEILDILEKFNIKNLKDLKIALKNYRNILDIISGGYCEDICIGNNDLMDYLTDYVNRNIAEHTADYPIRWENNR